ncbi:HTH-type transcriptional regulator DmlR [compost metagenome]
MRLFNRTTRRIALTEAGRDFLARIQPPLAAIDAAVETVNAFRSTPAGLLRINGSEAGFERLMPYVISFAVGYPDMRVDLVCEGRPIDIVAEGFDAGLRLAESVPQDMVGFPLGQEEATIVVGSPEYIARRGVPAAPGDLLSHACIRARLPSGSIMRWEFERHGQETRLDVPGNLTLGGDHLTLLAARAGLGLAQVTAWSAADSLADGRLVQVLADWTPPFAGVCLYYPRQKLPSAGLRAFIDHCQIERRRGGGSLRT